MANESTVITPEVMKEFKDAVKAAQVAARKIMSLDKSKLDDSADKFAHIRAVRVDHTARELLSGKSLRQ